MAAAWDHAATEAFVAIKHALTTAPVLCLPDWRSEQPFEIICDASLSGIGGVLLQGNRPVAFESRKLLPAEQNYSPTELEMLAVVHCCKTFRCYIEGKKVVLHTDHKPNTSFASQFMPSRRQARWVDLLQGFNLEWQYIKGKSNIADGLSRSPVVSALLKKRAPATPRALAGDADFLARVRLACANDAWFANAANLTNAHCDDGLYYRAGALLIPDDANLKAELLLECHSAPYSGHPGRERTLQLLRRHVWWTGMAADVRHFVQHCDAC